jgi:hypothetical protein
LEGANYAYLVGERELEIVLPQQVLRVEIIFTPEDEPLAIFLTLGATDDLLG